MVVFPRQEFGDLYAQPGGFVADLHYGSFVPEAEFGFALRDDAVMFRKMQGSGH